MKWIQATRNIVSSPFPRTKNIVLDVIVFDATSFILNNISKKAPHHRSCSVRSTTWNLNFLRD